MNNNWKALGVTDSVASQIPAEIAARVYNGAETVVQELGKGEARTGSFTDAGGCKLASKAKLAVKKADMSPAHAFIVYAWTVANLEQVLGPVNHITPRGVTLWYEKLQQRVKAEAEEAAKAAAAAAAAAAGSKQ